MRQFLTVLHALVALGIIGLVLLQRGRGAEAGAGFGGGASSTVFGARGSSTFLSRITSILAAIFFLTSLSLAYFAENAQKADHILDEAPPIEQSGVPNDLPATGSKTSPGLDNGDTVPRSQPDLPAVPADTQSLGTEDKEKE